MHTKCKQQKETEGMAVMSGSQIGTPATDDDEEEEVTNNRVDACEPAAENPYKTCCLLLCLLRHRICSVFGCKPIVMTDFTISGWITAG